MSAMARSIVILIVLFLLAACNIGSTVIGIEFVNLSRQPHHGLIFLNWITAILGVVFAFCSLVVFGAIVFDWHDGEGGTDWK